MADEPASDASVTDAKPYENADSVRDAARRFASSSTPVEQKSDILKRLAATGSASAPAATVMIESFNRLEGEIKYEVMSLFQTMAREGANLAEHADNLASYLNDGDTKLRDLVTDVLCEMGPASAKATTRILGCTRHSDNEVRICAIRVFGAMGNAGEAVSKGRLKDIMDDERSSPDLRKAAKEALEQIETGAAKPTAAAKGSALAGKSILIVEDTPPQRMLLMRFLQKQGANVSEAVNGLEGLTKIREAAMNCTPYDVVLSDMMMPKMNGLEMLNKVRKQDEIKDTPIFVMSAVNEKKPVKVALQLGISGYMLKPLQMKKVLATLNDFFTNQAE